MCHIGTEGRQRNSSTHSTLALGVGGWSAQCPGSFAVGRTPCTPCTGGWVGLRASLDESKKCRCNGGLDPGPSSL